MQTDKSRRFEFKTDPSNGCLIGPDGCHYDTEAEAMYYSSFAACGCGCPEEVHKLIVDCARQFDGDWPKPGVEAFQAGETLTSNKVLTLPGRIRSKLYSIL